MDPDEDAALLDQLNQVLAQKAGQQNQVQPEQQAVMDYSHLIKPCTVKVLKLSLADIEQLKSNLRRERPGNSSQHKPENTDRHNLRVNSLLHNVKQENSSRTGSRIGARVIDQGSSIQQRSESVPGRRSSRTSSVVGAESIRLLMRETDRSRSGSPASLRSMNTRKMASEHERSDSRASSRSSSKSGKHTRRDNERSDSRASSHSSSMNYKQEPEERQSRSKVRTAGAKPPFKLDEPMKMGSASNTRASVSKLSSYKIPKIKTEATDEESGSPSTHRRNTEKYTHLNLMLPVIKLEKVDLPTPKPSLGSSAVNQKIGPTSRTVEATLDLGPSTSGVTNNVRIGPKSKTSQVADDSSDSDCPIEVEDFVDSDVDSIISFSSRSRIKAIIDLEESDSDSTVIGASSVTKSSEKRSKIGPKSKMVPHACQSIDDSDVDMDDVSVTAQASSAAKSTSTKPKIGPKSKMAPHARQCIEDSDVDMDDVSVTAQASTVAKPTSTKPKIGPKSKMAPHACQSIEDSDVDMADDVSVTAQASSAAKSTSTKPKIGPKSKMAQHETQQSIEESIVDVESCDDNPVTAKASSVATLTSKKPKIGPKSKMAAQLPDTAIDKEKRGGGSVSVAEAVLKLPKIGPQVAQKPETASQVAQKSTIEPEAVYSAMDQVITGLVKSALEKFGPESGESRQQLTVRKSSTSEQRKQVDSDNESIICLDSESPEPDLQSTLKRVRDEFDADEAPSRKKARSNTPVTVKSVPFNMQQAGPSKCAAITKPCSINLDRDEIRRYLQKQRRDQKSAGNGVGSVTLLNILYPSSATATATTAVQTNLPAKQATVTSDTSESPKPKVSCVSLSSLKEPSPVNSPSSTAQSESILCVFCNNRFPTSSTLKYHLMLQHPDAVMVTKNNHYCPKCKTLFVHTAAYDNHKSKCDKLGVPPSQFQHARPHISQSPPEMLQPSPPFNAQVPILCDICGLNLPDSLSLARHKMDNHSFECGKCTMKFSCREALLKHRAEEHGQQQAQVPILCEICGLSFVDKLSMARHKNETHNFGCDKCAMNFNSLESFQNHRVEKHGYHKCLPCRLDFPDLEQLLQHVAVTEHPSTILVCDKCQIKFTKPEFLIRHNAVRHNIGYFCMKCLEVFGDITKTVPHYEKCKKKISNVLEFADGNEVLNKQRRHNCDQCPFKCSSEANLIIHKESFHKAQLQCPYCKKLFTSWGQHNLELCKRNLLQAQSAPTRNFADAFLGTLTQEKSTETVKSPQQQRKQSQPQNTPQTNSNPEKSPQMYSDPSEFLRIPIRTQNGNKPSQKIYQLQLPGTHMCQQKKTLNQRPVIPRPTYKCQQCRLEFPTLNTLIVHNMSHKIMEDVRTNNFHCKYCNEDYENIFNLTLHLKACWKNPKWNEFDGTADTTQEFAEVKLENYLSDEETESAVEFEKCSTDSVETVESPSKIHVIHTYFKCVHCMRLFDNSEKLQEHLNTEESVDKHMLMLTNDFLKKLLKHCKGEHLRLQNNSQDQPQTIECGNCSFSTTFQCQMIDHCKTCKPIEVLNLDEEPMEMETEDGDPLFSNQADSTGPTIVECHTEITEEDTTLPNLSSEPQVIISEESQAAPFSPDVQCVTVDSESDSEVQPADGTEKRRVPETVNVPSDTLTSENSEKRQDKQGSESVKETEPPSSKSPEILEVEEKQDSGNDKVITEIEPPSDNLVSESSNLEVEKNQSSKPMVTSVSILSVDSGEEQANKNTENVAYSTEIQASSSGPQFSEGTAVPTVIQHANSKVTNDSTEVHSDPAICDGDASKLHENLQNQNTDDDIVMLEPEDELNSTNKVTEKGIVENGKLDVTVLETELEPNCASAKESSTQGKLINDTVAETEPEPNTTTAKEGETQVLVENVTLDAAMLENEPSAKESSSPEDSHKLETDQDSAKGSNTQDSDDAVFEKIAEECTNSILQIQEKSMSSNSYGEEPEITPMDIDESAVFSHEDCSIPHTSFSFQSPTAVTPSYTGNPNTQTKHWDFAAPLTNR